MNYLAHMLLSENTPFSVLGNFMGDFVKGKAEGKFSDEIVRGIMNHRRIDHFTDTSAIVSSSKRLISRSRSRFSGVIVDIAYDHFLFRNWKLYSKTGLDEFIERTYKNLVSHGVDVPDTASTVIERMIREDWLGSYGSMAGIDRTFKRMSRRVTRENDSLGSAAEEIENHYDELNRRFLRFFPALLKEFPVYHDRVEPPLTPASP